MLYSVEQACRKLGIGRTLFYDLKNRGVILVTKLGRRTLISKEEIDRVIEQQTLIVTSSAS